MVPHLRRAVRRQSAEGPEATDTGRSEPTASAQVIGRVVGAELVRGPPRQKYKFRPSLGGDGSR